MMRAKKESALRDLLKELIDERKEIEQARDSLEDEIESKEAEIIQIKKMLR